MQDTLLFMFEVPLIVVYTVGTSETVVEGSQYNSRAQNIMSQFDFMVYKLVFRNFYLQSRAVCNNLSSMEEPLR